ncbi:enoyl-CoA hydratase/isomerase family protein [Halomarina halobia]|uniref:Enoyl-CoA hydratase/isomerase family protein n=1 Tax=Halomarina halobia TaxID=3033386 RepID=A0ABD6ADN7_9EURY|nr:enoyl-CoA hydratase/isomerase family protein [Halomarina sp. PSR21]
MVAVDTDAVVTSVEDGLVSVELNRPEKLNALTPEMIDGLHGAFTELNEDPPAAVLLAGRGRATCAGMDVEIVSQDYETDFADVDALAQELYALVEELPCPVAMAARGALVGMGFVVSLSCDFLVVGEGTTLSVPEVKYDIASERTARRLPELVGHRPAAELLLTGEPISPARAHELGLANAVVPSDEVDDRARALLASITEHDRETVTELCSLLRGGESNGR